MQSLGTKLRLERERQKLSIEKIAEDTRISLRYLQAIEADDQSSLPGEFFYRAFVRQYSKFLGWNPDEIEKQINLVSSLPNSEPVEAVAPATGNGLNISGESQITALRESLKDKPMRPAQDDGMSKKWLVFAAAVIVLCGAYFAWRNFTPTAQEPVVQAQQQQPVVATPPPQQQPQQQQPPPVAAAPEVTTPTPETAVPTEPVKKQDEPTGTPGAGKFGLTVRAREATWIRLVADGARVYLGVLDPGQERTVNAASAELLVGNAGTLDVIYNGKPLSYGVKGEVKTLLVSPEGWKLKPKPVEAPAASPTGSSSAGDAGLGGTAPRAL